MKAAKARFFIALLLLRTHLDYRSSKYWVSAKVNQLLQGSLDYYLRTQTHLLVVEAKQADSWIYPAGNRDDCSRPVDELNQGFF